MDELEIGEPITLTGEFLNAAGALADPTAVTLTITSPTGSVTILNTGSLTHASTGIYTYDTTPGEAGVWSYRFAGTGAVAAGTGAYFVVNDAAANRLRGGPCADWCSIADVQALPQYATVAVGTLARMIPVASKMLYDRTAHRYSGICAATVRPSRRPEGELAWPFYGPWMATWQQSWGSGSCWRPGNPFGGCGCQGPPSIDLGYYPVRQITSVIENGVTLSPTAYRLDDHRWLTRIDGNGWSACQDLSLATTQNGTMSVSLLYGSDIPVDGNLAACILAGELTKAATAQTCQLPKRIVTITRQGQTQQLFDPKALAADRLFGIFEIDSFVAGVNPHGLARRSTITSPDARRPVRRAGF